MTKKQLQNILANMDSPELIDILLMLNTRSKECQNILSAYFNQVDPSEIFEETKAKVERCFRKDGRPAPRDPKLREAKKYISDYKKMFPHDKNRILELYLAYCFFLAELLSEFGGGDESWEDSLINTFADCYDTIKENHWEEEYRSQFKHIIRTLNRNYCELLEDYEDL